jgi:pimeloyl-ACP methyl ester carboxylesterase
MHPGRVAGVIGLNTPFMPRAPMDPIALMRMRFGPDMYIVWFQTPGDADAVLGADVEKTMRFFMRKPAGLATTAQPAEGGSTFAFKDLLQQWDPTDLGTQLLNAEELAVFVDTFRATGFTGGINWYRNFTRNWERSEGQPGRIDGLPCLMITAELDPVLTPASAEGMPGLIGDLEMHMVAGSGPLDAAGKAGRGEPPHPALAGTALPAIDWSNGTQHPAAHRLGRLEPAGAVRR